MRDFLLPQRKVLIWVSGLRIHASHVEWCGERVVLSLAKYRVVNALAQAPGIPLSHAAIARIHSAEVTSEQFDPTERAVSAIKCIRKAFRAIDPAFDEIETRWKIGFSWKDHAEAANEMVGEAA